MKPVGPIPSGYETIEGELAISGRKAGALVEEAGGTPLFVYSRALLSRRVADLRAALPERIGINYAVKANPMPDLVAHMEPLVDGFDIASSGELAVLQGVGIDPARISFAGPGKRDDELEAAIAAGVTLNCESAGEAARSLAIGERLGKPPRIAIRVNPSFELKGSGMKMGGGAKPFGVDAEKVPALARHVIAQGAEWRGLHIFTGSQALSAEAIAETQANVLNLAAGLADAIGHPLPRLNMGGGFGIPYFPGDEPLDLAAVGRALGERVANLPASLADTGLCLELGRYLAGEAGVYLCRVVDRKESHGQVYLVTDGGLHHQLAASGNFGTVVRRNYPSAIATRYAEPAAEEVNIVGCLCTPLDRLADQAMMPRADVGDLVAVFCAGAYGASASPSGFLGHGPARELLV
ncbi:pyridoxal-dependent decarboxylase, exosortase A system-associated [Erythrobacter sp. HL-111]|uniref:pyridoxal-dependent decarboxylase, exosortase A system-associated n=1 Tax=Erythrobacter sp. HL-111 TaxID=1798193 RepID=UPI0006DB24D7|nr:pyridoxal-dependent decarboxylase, exosortase A system-associated [Erythrobacter sp. HL-111]KPP96579.1 MAG: exosortase A system pyridoxal-dependent decarboxylase [Erythrobacteraceae bacterium HL-111]SDS03205.1 diaminopimelate decarboxylase [Erythrobacter sp. HL-111]